jgi:hypothetical protein
MNNITTENKIILIAFTDLNFNLFLLIWLFRIRPVFSSGIRPPQIVLLSMKQAFNSNVHWKLGILVVPGAGYTEATDLTSGMQKKDTKDH